MAQTKTEKREKARSIRINNLSAWQKLYYAIPAEKMGFNLSLEKAWEIDNTFNELIGVTTSGEVLKQINLKIRSAKDDIKRLNIVLNYDANDSLI